VTGWHFFDSDEIRPRALTHGRLFGAAGVGATILFVHGGFHGAWCWSTFLALCRERNRPAAALDLRGHGGLKQDRTFLGAGVDAMAEDVVEAARALGGPIILAGHSLGARVVLRATRSVSPVGVILMAPAPPAGILPRPSLPRFPADNAVAPPPEARARRWFLPGYIGDDIGRYLARLCPESPALLNDCFQDDGPSDDGFHSAPMLVVSGGKDDTALHVAGQDASVAAAYGAELTVISQSGHCLMLDDGKVDAFNAIDGWLRRTGLTPP